MASMRYSKVNCCCPIIIRVSSLIIITKLLIIPQTRLMMAI